MSSAIRVKTPLDQASGSVPIAPGPGIRRRIALWLADRIGVPLIILPLRLLVCSWRKDGPSEERWRALLAAPRVVFATYHGMLLHCIAFSHMPPRFGRPLAVMVSPSLGGTVLGMILRRFGMTPIYGKPGRRGAASARRFVRALEAGNAGVVAVDGSRGPCCVVKPGALWIARIAKADVLITATSAGWGITFPTWDRAHLPAPFARVTFTLERLPEATLASSRYGCDDLQRTLIESARRIHSTVLPPRLRAAATSS